ncbi:MAG: GNAT family protein [Phycisphaerales bacterium]
MPLAPVTLQGPHVRLEPLTRAHAPDLLAAADPATFAHMPLHPETWDAAGFDAYVDALIASPAIVPFATIDARTNKAVGSTSFYDLRPDHRGISIGYTWVAPAARGSPINPAAKLLMMTHAFETPIFPAGPAIRVQLKTDARNERSQRAMARLGFTREGTLRHHMVLPDGRLRDSVIFSVTSADWPAVKARLHDAIAAPPRG